MNFSEALKAMKMGSKVSREAWRGTIAHWELSSDHKIISEIRADHLAGKVFDKVPLEDILADDWWIVT